MMRWQLQLCIWKLRRWSCTSLFTPKVVLTNKDAVKSLESKLISSSVWKCWWRSALNMWWLLVWYFHWYCWVPASKYLREKLMTTWFTLPKPCGMSSLPWLQLGMETCFQSQMVDDSSASLQLSGLSFLCRSLQFLFIIHWGFQNRKRGRISFWQDFKSAKTKESTPLKWFKFVI